jgi:hypothetical protein
MYVFVSWAYTSSAEAKFLSLVESLPKAENEDVFAAQKEKLSQHLPEYTELTETLTSKKQSLTLLPMDKLNRELLAVKIAIPKLESVTTFQLSKRLPGSDKLPVSLAVRSFLLNLFPDEWSSDITAPASNRVVFVGLPGIRDFFVRLGYCTAALGSPLPPGLLLNTRMIEPGIDDSFYVRNLLDACAFNAKDEDTKAKYESITERWVGTGCSAEVDNLAILAAAAACGFCGKG